MPNSGRDNLIPGSSSTPRRADTYIHMQFVVWAMQQPDIDSITVRRVKNAMRCSMTTAAKLREFWRTLTSTQFYRYSVPDIVNVQARIFGLGSASNEE